MIHEEICTYEVAKLAKKKGFNVPTDRYYHIYNDVIEAQNSLEMTRDGCADFYNSLNRCRCAAPTQGILQRWLREEKGLHISIPLHKGEYKYFWGIDSLNRKKKEEDIAYNLFDTYELALEAALKYALENLV
jgi:hypothetical protein